MSLFFAYVAVLQQLLVAVCWRPDPHSGLQCTLPILLCAPQADPLRLTSVLNLDRKLC